MAKTESVTVQMEELFDEVSKRVKVVMETSIKQTAVETAQRLRADSPKGPNGYAEGWKVGKKRGGDYVVHNATHYRLTHLLENSHLIKNKKGEYGRTSPEHGQVIHIKPNEEWAIDELPRRVMEDLDREL